MAQIILPTREVEKQEAPKESAMDKLLKGLQIASSAFGIGSSVSNMATQSQARDIAASTEARNQSKFSLDAMKNTQEAEGQAGGVPITLQRPGDSGEQFTSLRVPRPETPDETAKMQKELLSLRVAKARKEANQKPNQERIVEFSPEDKNYWTKQRGVDPALVDMVSRGFGGRNPTNTLNMAAERDEPSAAEINTINGFDEADEILGAALEDINPDWVGPLRGRAPEIPVLGGYVAEGPEAAWRAKIGRMNDAYRKAITGMGASQKEIETLMTRIPSPNDTFKQFLAKAKDFDSELAQKRELYLHNLDRGGKFVDAFKAPGSTIVYQQLKQQNPTVQQNPATFAPGVSFPSLIPEAQAEQPFDKKAFLRGN